MFPYMGTAVCTRLQGNVLSQALCVAEGSAHAPVGKCIEPGVACREMAHFPGRGQASKQASNQASQRSKQAITQAIKQASKRPVTCGTFFGGTNKQSSKQARGR